MKHPLVSVVIRTKNEAASIGEVLALLGAQTIADRMELIVVDSGSSDGTPAIARRAGVTPIEIPADSFSFGGSLNTGCQAAAAPLIIALSGHAFPTDERWAERMVAAFEDDRVACAHGLERGPDGSPLDHVILQDEEHASRFPFWGYSNAAGAFRADLWRRRPWRADMPGTEDKEWAWAWLQAGYLVRIDPGLWVDHDHSHDDLRSTFARSRREWVGYGMYLDLPAYPFGALAREWWSELDGHESRLRARLSPWRCSELLGKYAGRRR